VNSGWDKLAELRRRGRFPKLVIVTDVPRHPLAGGPDLIIEQPSDVAMPLHLLEDLDVIFWFQTCAAAARVFHAAREKGIRFDRARCFCRCACAISVVTYDCASFPAMIERLTGGA
jgi:hypothetical protein